MAFLNPLMTNNKQATHTHSTKYKQQTTKSNLVSTILHLLWGLLVLEACKMIYSHLFFWPLHAFEDMVAPECTSNFHFFYRSVVGCPL